MWFESHGFWDGNHKCYYLGFSSPVIKCKKQISQNISGRLSEKLKMYKLLTLELVANWKSNVFEYVFGH